MKKVIEIAVLMASAFVATVSCSAAEGGEVLWWMIGSDYQTGISGTTKEGGAMTAGELGVKDARIRYQDASGNTLGYLPLYALDGDNNVHVFPGNEGLGLPGSYFGDLSDLAGSLTAYSFVLELGNYDEGSWVHTSMESEAASYNDLVANKHISEWRETTPTYGTPWKPTNFTVVPEPNSGLMLLVGGAFLVLRRRRRG